MEKYLYPSLLIISIAALIFYLYKTHTKWLATVCIRVVAGIIVILLLNTIFGLVHIQCQVGINALTVSTVGLLGVPGLILIYGAVYFFTRI